MFLQKIFLLQVTVYLKFRLPNLLYVDKDI